MKLIKLIIIFVVILGGVVGALFLLTDGKTDVTPSSSDTNMLPDTTVIGDTAIIEDATDEDNRITDYLEEEEVVYPPQKTTLKQKGKANSSGFKQGKKSSVGKEKEKSSGRKKEIKHKYTCKICGHEMWFKTKMELNNHMHCTHCEEL